MVEERERAVQVRMQCHIGRNKDLTNKMSWISLSPVRST
jgi:hypothetical protein